MRFPQTVCSLADLVGLDYVEAACRARAFLSGEPVATLRALATGAVDLWPAALQERLRQLLPQVGQRVVEPLAGSAPGNSTEAFQAATRAAMAPLSGLGWYRVGEDGRLYVIAKSEHYHASLGHAFPGYALIERARSLGIPNATHNNTRGHITRCLEAALLAAANLPVAGAPAPAKRLERVLNLETGSLALEAALKLVLARFHPHEASLAKPLYAGRTPVLLVLGDDDGGLSANYHGTTVLTQVMRGLWPTLRPTLEAAGLFRLRAIRLNSLDDLESAFREADGGGLKVAAFFHEIIMMNYGARVVSPEFLRRAYELCRERDVVTVVDEIQSCAWCEGGFLFRHYGLEPDLVALGKGFPGGEFPASRLLFTAPLDVLPQFGALVTNGQEELASLAYLVTLAWERANAAGIAAAGALLEAELRRAAAAHPRIVEGVSGRGHLLGLRFRDLAQGRAFTATMNAAGYDISVQSYKASCPPVALCKLPVIADEALIEAFVGACRTALAKIG